MKNLRFLLHYHQVFLIKKPHPYPARTLATDPGTDPGRTLANLSKLNIGVIKLMQLIKKVKNMSSNVTFERSIANVEYYLSKGAAFPVLGAIAAAAKVILGIIQMIGGFLALIISVPFLGSNGNRERSTC